MCIQVALQGPGARVGLVSAASGSVAVVVLHYFSCAIAVVPAGIVGRHGIRGFYNGLSPALARGFGIICFSSTLLLSWKQAINTQH